MVGRDGSIRGRWINEHRRRKKTRKHTFRAAGLKPSHFTGKITFGGFWNRNGSADECFGVKPGDLVNWEQRYGFNMSARAMGDASTSVERDVVRIMR